MNSSHEQRNILKWFSPFDTVTVFSLAIQSLTKTKRSTTDTEATDLAMAGGGAFGAVIRKSNVSFLLRWKQQTFTVIGIWSK